MSTSSTAPTRGRPVLGVFSGFFLGFFVSLDLLFFGVVHLDNVIITILPIAGLVVGLGLGFWAPIGRGAAAPAFTPAPAPAPGPPPTTAADVPPSAPSAADTTDEVPPVTP